MCLYGQVTEGFKCLSHLDDEQVMFEIVEAHADQLLGEFLWTDKSKPTPSSNEVSDAFHVPLFVLMSSDTPNLLSVL